MLTALQRAEDPQPLFFCGCFTGTESELREYIAKNDPEKYARTRTLALDTALALLNA